MAVATGAFAPRAFAAGAFYVSLVGPTATAIPIGVSAGLTVDPQLVAGPDLQVGVVAALSTGSAPLAVAAAIVFSTTAGLPVAAQLAAAASISLSVTPPTVSAASHPLSSGLASGFNPSAFYVVRGAFSGGLLASGFTVRTTTALQAAVVFRATPTIAVGTTPRLTSVPQFFTATAGVRVATSSTLALVGPTAWTLQITINGAHVEDQIRLGSITISDILNEAPNTATFTANAPIHAGADVKIGLQSLIGANLLFAGTIKQVDQAYDLQTDQPVWTARADDYTWLINRRKVFGRWTNVSASQVALEALQRFTTGFSGGGIAAGLPPITISVDGVDFMDFLTQVANLCGGYAGGPDYSRTVWLFLTDPRPAPDPLTPDNRALMLMPPLRASADTSQIRTRVYVRGTSSTVVGPAESSFPAGITSELPLTDAAAFAPAGQAIDDAGQILGYTGTTPGGLTATIGSAIPPPTPAPSPALAVGVAGLLSGWYQWAIAFGSDTGETTIGPATIALYCPDVTTPTAAPGIGATGSVGPLVGQYYYRVAYLTTLGETLPGPIVGRYANPLQALAPTLSTGAAGVSALTPGAYAWCLTYVTADGETLPGPSVSTFIGDLPAASPPSVQTGSAAGPLAPGASYGYRVTFVTASGESAGGASAFWTPPALNVGGLGFNSASPFGGIYGGPYAYGVSIVTAIGESNLATIGAGSNWYTNPPQSAPSWAGVQDNGRIETGHTYIYASSFFSDAFGETPLGPGRSQLVGGPAAYPVALLMYLNLFLPDGADGIRVYRALSGSAMWTLNAEFRRGSIPSQWWDSLAQGDQGAQWPIGPLRLGVNISLSVASSPEPGIVGRRIYRTKAGGSDYYLVGELPHNAATPFYDGLPDAQLGTHSPLVATTGRSALVTLPIGPAGVTGRRLYRTKANGSSYYLVADIKDNGTSTFVDTTPDASLTVALPGVSAAGGDRIPRLILPAAPSGVVARRLYRTKANGSTFGLVAEVPGNSGSFAVAAGVVDDTTPDASLGAAPPLVSTAGGDTQILTSIPIGPIGTLARLLYRTVGNGTEFRELVQLSDNSTTTWIDSVADDNLGRGGVQLVNKAGASAVQLSGIPVGPAGVTSRLIYRTEASGTAFRYVGTIDDNVATTFLDTRGDSSLGRAPQDTATIGALLGDTTLVLDPAANSAADFPPAGWVRVDNQYLHYTGKTGALLTGIPATGPGSITANIRGGAVVTSVAMLTGVWTPAPLLVGARIAIWITQDDRDAQAALAAIEGGDGIHEYIVTDSNLLTINACTARAVAELELFADVALSLEYTSRDRKTRSGAIISCALPAPQALTGDFRIQQVRITDIGTADRTFPKYTVQASTTKYSLADLLRHVAINWQGFRR